MKHVTEEYALIMNLANVAIFHAIECKTPDCNVSLYQLRQAARYIHSSMIAKGQELSQIEDCRLLIENMPTL